MIPDDELVAAITEAARRRHAIMARKRGGARNVSWTVEDLISLSWLHLQRVPDFPSELNELAWWLIHRSIGRAVHADWRRQLGHEVGHGEYVDDLHGRATARCVTEWGARAREAVEVYEEAVGIADPWERDIGREVFFAGRRAQDIADELGIRKNLVHSTLNLVLRPLIRRALRRRGLFDDLAERFGITSGMGQVQACLLRREKALARGEAIRWQDSPPPGACIAGREPS